MLLPFLLLPRPYPKSYELKTTNSSVMFRVSLSFANIKMCSVSATPDLGIGNDEVNVRNPVEADPRVAKCIILADLN